jgi:hypothetical protein
MNDYFIKAPTFSSPGDKEYASGHVDFKYRTFKVHPVVSEWSNRSFRIVVYGKVLKDSIVVNFGTPITSFVIPLIFYGILFRIFISENWESISYLTLPTLFIVVLLNFILARRSYRKDLRNRLEFLDKMIVK